MHHFFVSEQQVEDNSIIIKGQDVNHLSKVLRCKVGEQVFVSTAAGRSFQCEVAVIGEDEVSLTILAVQEDNHELPSKIYLFQGLPKGDKMELIVQKAVELGVFEVIPVAMKRAIVKLDGKKAESKVKRWNGIAESAAKQSMRGLIPVVKPVMTFKEALAYAEDIDVKLLPYENESGIAGARATVAAVESGQSIAIFIGPEGGFDESEVIEGKNQGFKSISLGKRILRTETAGMTMLSILMFHLERGQ